jgi:hypothetical protein
LAVGGPQQRLSRADADAMLSFQRLDVYQRSIQFLAFASELIARGEAMECAASLDVLKVRRLIEQPRYERGIELLEAVVAMLTKMITVESST